MRNNPGTSMHHEIQETPFDAMFIFSLVKVWILDQQQVAK